MTKTPKTPPTSGDSLSSAEKAVFSAVGASLLTLAAVWGFSKLKRKPKRKPKPKGSKPHKTLKYPRVNVSDPAEIRMWITGQLEALKSLPRSKLLTFEQHSASVKDILKSAGQLSALKLRVKESADFQAKKDLLSIIHSLYDLVKKGDLDLGSEQDLRDIKKLLEAAADLPDPWRDYPAEWRAKHYISTVAKCVRSLKSDRPEGSAEQAE